MELSQKIMITLCCLVISCFPLYCEGSKILLFPLDVGYNSKLMNMLKLGRMLTKAKHQVTCVISDRMREDALFKLAERETFDSSFKVISYKTPPVDPDVMQLNTENQGFLDAMINKDVPEIVQFFSPTLTEPLDYMLQDKTIAQLATEEFDLIFADEIVFFPRIMAAKRNIPIILYSNFGPLTADTDIVPRYSLAFVNGCFNRFSDMMTFSQRMENVWEYLRMRWVMSDIYSESEVICRKHGYGESCDNIRGIHKTVNLVLMNRNDVIHYPAPYMPHIISLEGFFLDKPKPLNSPYKEIVQKSGKHGIIVVSFGSMFRRLGLKHRNIFAKAFSAMPQTVIWSYEGETPEGLGENTFVNKWIPQTDLLANPAVQLFVTQCGASSLFEALNYGVPVVCIPFIGDQEYNCLKLVERVKSAKNVPLKGITSRQLQSTMEEVINNITYRENAKKAALIYHDQPIDPRKKSLYWIEYVIRHKGAPHLRSAGESQLSFFQYYLLDIASLVGVVVFAAVISIAFVMKAAIKGLLRTTKSKED
ncbi:unnamed protein product [Owenia fusiformis]|uniref:UDP-glucuronosyltransferase n=1 Tax=Owenia fusiformis TaxID=6347 RepID=A0A8S4PV98_OWEFU|nr:unnamed protein product [Owenia fusiformis]